MAITASDVALMLSITTGSAGATAAQANPNLSLGKYVSTTALSGTSLNNLFDDISGSENAASAVDYRCIFIQNNHATLTMIGTKVWIQSQVASGASCQIAADNTGTSVKGSSSAQAAQIADELTAPSGVGTFVDAATAGAAITLGDIPAGSVKAIWIKRTAANTGPVDNDGLTLQVDFDTTA